MNILIVDDIEDNIESLERLITQFTRKYNVNCTVLQAQNGQKAVDICDENKIDLVFMDIMMPVMNGKECCKVLKSSSDTSDIPIIVLSAKSYEEDLREMFELGIDSYITKPFSEKRLLKVVEDYLSI